jgi:uncharacterized iron-regulated membrane protein
MAFRPFLFWAHLVVGSLVGLFVLNMAASGAILAFEPQIVAWAEQDLRFVPPPGDAGVRLGPDALLASVSAAFPEARPTGLTLRSAPGSSALVSLGRDGGVYVDPYRGNVLGRESAVHRALHAVEDWHRYLGSRDVGKPITGAACVGFLFLLVSGAYLWFRYAILRFEWRLSGKARDFNWHNAIGFWTAPLILITTASGLVMSYPWANDLLFRALGSTPPARREPAREGARTARGERLPLPALDAAWAAAESRLPSWRSLSLRLPQSEGAPLTFTIDDGNGRSARRSQLLVDARTGEVRKWEPFAQQSRGARVRALVKPLHTGQLGGLLGQCLAFASAVGTSVLVWTGLALAWSRFRAWRARVRTPQRAAA